ncbi:MAG TPA: class F sortase [Candidatus Saccharimonadales bacterium]|nr:class F sortase [Candidatus Saccharimonadales bacterium]
MSVSVKHKLSSLLKAIKHRKLLVAASCVAVALIGFGVVQLGVRVARTTGTAPPPNPKEVITQDIDQPVEKKAAYDDYKVAADQPRLIKLPTLDAVGPIQKVGITKDNAIAVPTNVNFAGWYTGSVKPGYPGLSVIDAHVSGKYTSGLFKQLPKLKTGDAVQITYGDGTVRSFEVVEGKVLPQSEAGAYLLTKRATIDRQLNLITCDGVYDRTTKQYDKRYVIVAKAVD